MESSLLLQLLQVLRHVLRKREREASHQKSIVQNAHGSAHLIGARRANCKLAMRALRFKFRFFFGRAEGVKFLVPK
jgi:hypothetical protein